jgi:N-succinyldiaminopimelate aminotransferase
MAKTALRGFGTSIFSEMTRLANAHGAINLSQGFPDFEGPPALVDAAVEALRGGANQYVRSQGSPALCRAIAAHQRRFYGLEYDDQTEVAAFAGATEGIAAALLGLLDPGDEVVLFEPFYDSYPACAAMAGATVRHVTLRFPRFALDLDALQAAITDRTKAIVLNSPHNPTGKVFTVDELDAIAAIARARDLIVIADEVYEHLVYGGARHVPMATRPGMRERTISLSSSGKTFSFTGWKVGWATGPAHLVEGLQRAHQFLTFCGAAPLQAAVARGLESVAPAYYDELAAQYEERRDFLVDALRSAGFTVAVPDGAYFVLADFRALDPRDDVAYARHLVTEIGVAAIPPSAFYAANVDEGRRLLRFAFCKKRETLAAAASRLALLRKGHARVP